MEEKERETPPAAQIASGFPVPHRARARHLQLKAHEEGKSEGLMQAVSEIEMILEVPGEIRDLLQRWMKLTRERI